MAFTDKYEVLECVTRGRVESFVARNRATNERVLAHIFNCPEQKPQQPTMHWVLESFYAIAPEPAGSVIDTGQYVGTSYAYLITKLPNEDCLQEWVNSYAESQSTTVVDEPAAGMTATSGVKKVQEIPASDRDPLGGSAEAHGITQAFEALRLGLAPDSSARQDTSSASDLTGNSAATGGDTRQSHASIAPNSKRDEPGEFTKNFFSEFSGSQQGPAIGVSPGSSGREDLVRGSTPADILISSVRGSSSPPSEDSSASSVFESGSALTVKPWEGTPPFAASSSSTTSPTKAPVDGLSRREEASPGEFTSFFRAPFDGARAQQTPDIQASGPPPAKQPGEFTEVFGPVKEGFSAGGPPPRAAGGPAASSDPDSITGILAELESHPKKETQQVIERRAPARPSSNVVAPVLSTEREASKSRSLVPQGTGPPDLFSPGRSPGNVPQSEVRDVDPGFTSGSEPAGATRVFSSSERGPMPDRASLPEGPSEYTRFISGGLRSVAPAKEPPIASVLEEPSAGQRDAVNLAPVSPSAPLPHMSGPNLPQFPQAGGYPQMKAPPPFVAPPVPQTPKVGSETPKAATVPWALILILNGLFVLAVLLVLYFALKH